jgi:hypothetical protein
MNDQLPPEPASEPGETQPASEPRDEPVRLEYLAGAAEAGDSACWAQLVCPGCGAMLSEGACPCDAASPNP